MTFTQRLQKMHIAASLPLGGWERLADTEEKCPPKRANDVVAVPPKGRKRAIEFWRAMGLSPIGACPIRESTSVRLRKFEARWASRSPQRTQFGGASARDAQAVGLKRECGGVGLLRGVGC